MNTLEQVKAIIGNHAGIDSSTIRADQPLGEDPESGKYGIGTTGLAFDSLDRIELGILLGEHFDIEIPDADLDKPDMGTPQGIATYIGRRLASGASEGNHVPNMLSGYAERYAAAGEDTQVAHGDALVINIGSAPEASPAIPDYRKMQDGEMLAAIGLDAQKWRDAFMQLAVIGHASFTDAAGLDLFSEVTFGWFANSIALARDAGRLPSIDEMSDVGRSLSWRKKPVVVQAVCFREISGTAAVFNHPELPEWVLEAMGLPDCELNALWVVPGGGTGEPSARDPMGQLPREPELHACVLRGPQRRQETGAVPAGWWITRNEAGELDVIAPDIFAATYEPAHGAEAMGRANDLLFDAMRSRAASDLSGQHTAINPEDRTHSDVSAIND